MIIAEKMFPEYGRDELFLSQTERIALNACFEAVRIEVAGKVKLNRSGSARSKVGRSVPQGDFHSGDGSGLLRPAGIFPGPIHNYYVS